MPSSARSHILSPLSKSLAYALAQGDSDTADDLIIRLQNEDSTSLICAYFAQAQLAYGRRIWSDLALSLRYLFCYGVKDQWAAGILAALYQHCDCFEYAEFILEQCKTEVSNIFIQLEDDEYEQLKYALLKTITPPHLKTKPNTASNHSSYQSHDSTQYQTTQHSTTFKKFVTDVPISSELPTWVMRPESTFSSQSLQSQQQVPSWLEQRTPFSMSDIQEVDLQWLNHKDASVSQSSTHLSTSASSSSSNQSIESLHQQNPSLVEEWLQEGKDWATKFKLNAVLWSIVIHQPRLSQPPNQVRALKGEFLLALTQKFFVLAQLHNDKHKPWIFHAKDCAQIDWSRSKILSIIFRDQRKILCDLSHTSHVAGKILQNRFQQWIKASVS